MAGSRAHAPKLGVKPSGRKIEQILRAARKLFLEHGYSDTSMDAVAVESGVSKATLYAYFETKKDLFAAIIDEFSTRYSSAELEKNTSTQDIRLTLLHLAQRVVELLTSPDVVAAHRMVTAEAVRAPELGRLYYDTGPAHLIQRVEAVLRHAMKHGQLRTAPTELAADHFINLVKSDLRLRALICVDGVVAEKEKKNRIRSGVDVFYRAYRPDDARKPK